MCRVRALVVMTIFLYLIAAASNVSRAAGLQSIEIVTRNNTVIRFEVEMAVTPEETERGLMFRAELPDLHGMLFDFFHDEEMSFWMKNTLISLDMIFIRSDGCIMRIAENTEVKSEKLIPSTAPVRAVLEVIAGTAKKYGIARGDRVRGQSFANTEQKDCS
jgi:uncharacterized membrane protein (UPF0127 family)